MASPPEAHDKQPDPGFPPDKTCAECGTATDGSRTMNVFGPIYVCSAACEKKLSDALDDVAV